jgi:hypothetical protein
MQVTYYNIYNHKLEENRIATYTGCGNANSTVNSLTKRSGTKKEEMLCSDTYQLKKGVMTPQK